MSTISAELASLSTSSVIDFYRRWIRPEANDDHFLLVSRVATGFWGVFASVVAIWSTELGSLIEVVNRFGSYFYGSILGVFLLAIWWKRANGHGAFAGVIAGMAAVGYVATTTKTAYLWLNVVGAVSVFVVGAVVSELLRNRRAT
jgi:Na+/proline symporter